MQSSIEFSLTNICAVTRNTSTTASSNEMATGKRYKDEDAISMNSMGHLHGRVDFAGIEARKANKPIYQKLKVVQTWIFLQALLITLMLAYLILLSVWLAPFFPMNYNTDDQADANSAAIAMLRHEDKTLEGQVNNNADSIGDLQEWRQNQTEETNEMNSTIIALQQEVNDLQNETAELNSTVSQLQAEVHELRLANAIQDATILAILRRLDALDGGVLLPTAQSGVAFDARTRLDDYHERIMKLECFKDKIRDIVKETTSGTDEKICNLTKTLGDVVGEIELFHGHNKLLSGNATMHRTRIDKLQNELSGMKQKLNKTAEGVTEHIRWTRDRFIQQDDLRAAALEKQRIVLETEVGKLQCSVETLNETMRRNFEHHGEVLHEKVSIAADEVKGHADETRAQLTIQMDGLRGEAQGLVDEAKVALSAIIQGVQQAVDDEKDSRQHEYLHLCEKIDDVIDDVNAKFGNASHQMSNVKTEVDRLSSSFAGVEETNRILGRNFRQFQQESIATDQDLHNRSCTMEKKVVEHHGRLVQLAVRVNNTEHNVDSITNQLAGDILGTEASALAAIAEMSRKQNNFTDAIAQVQRQYAQLRRDLGDEFLSKLISDVRAALGISTPQPVSSFSPLRDSPELESYDDYPVYESTEIEETENA